MNAIRMVRPLALAGVVLAGACGGNVESRPAANAPAPPLFTAETATVSVPLSFPAQLYVEQDTWLYARAAGLLDSLLVDLGSTVRAGDVVARLESTDQAIALQRAEVAWDAARRNVDRAHQLAQTRNIAPADVELAETELRTAELGRTQARRNVELTRIATPFTGVIAARSNVRVGRLVAVGDSIVRVTALAPLRAAVHVPEAQAAALAVGSTASVSGSGGTARATVIRAAPSVDAASGTRELVLELAGSATLSPGASVIVRIGGERRRVVVIPAAAVSDSGYVVVWQDGRTALRAVTLGARLPDGRVEIASGLAAGERVMPARP